MGVSGEWTDATKRWGSTISERWNTHTNTHTGQLVPRTLLHKRYIILKVIGKGGMGAVYQAKDMKRQGALCAVKEMSLSMVPSEEQAQAIKNFKIEAKMLSVLAHPYLPAFTHFFAENQRYFLVMEYINGATLEELLERNQGPFSEQRVLSWAKQLCEVLEYLHSQNPPIIFRDMKPGNVMLTRQGHIKLIDFGIARFFRPTHEMDTQLLGTPGYSPREQYGTTQTDERSDIYALGMTLHHLLTNTFSEAGFGVRAREVRTLNPQVSVAVARVLEKATAVEPADRYESVEAFRYALLGTRAFIFENGETASEPVMLAELCARYPEEAFEYLETGEIADWLRDIGEEGLSAMAWHIRTTEPDPLQAVEQFLHAVLGPNVSVPSSSLRRGRNGNSQHAVPWVGEDQSDDLEGSQPLPYNALGQDRSRVPRYGTAVLVKPRTLDFGAVYPPSTSAPLKITIAGPQDLWVKGAIQASQPWILLDRTEFDGTNTYVNVQIRSAQLSSYKTYTGEVVICPEGGTPVTIAVEAEIQGYKTSEARRPGKTISPEDDDEDDYEEPLLSTKPQQVVQTVRKPISVASLDQDALIKYGTPNETLGGWGASMMTEKQQRRSRYGLTFATACMVSAFWYIFLTQVLYLMVSPSHLGFVLLMTGMLLTSTLGAMLVERSHAWRDRETVDRLITGLGGALLVLGPTNALLQVAASALGSSIGPMGLLILFAVTALGATYSVHPVVSKSIWSRLLQVSTQKKLIHWAIMLVAGIGGAALGYLLTVGIALSGFTLFGILVGIGIAIAFIGRLDHLLKLYRRP